MSKIHIELNCWFCDESYKTEIEVPEGWWSYGDITNDTGLCPNHSKIAEFKENVCSGCVGGFNDCSLFSSFTHTKMELTESDLTILRQGVCPKRTNGSLSFSRETGLKSIDLSSPATKEAGEAFVRGILEYREKYCKRTYKAGNSL